MGLKENIPLPEIEVPKKPEVETPKGPKTDSPKGPKTKVEKTKSPKKSPKGKGGVKGGATQAALLILLEKSIEWAEYEHDEYLKQEDRLRNLETKAELIRLTIYIAAQKGDPKKLREAYGKPSLNKDATGHIAFGIVAYKGDKKIPFPLFVCP